MSSAFSFTDLSDRIKKNDASVLNDIVSLLNQEKSKEISESEKLDLIFLKSCYYLIIKADYTEARKIAVKGKVLFKKNSNPISESRIWRIIATTYQFQGKYSDASKNYLKAAALLEQVPVKTEIDYQDLAGIYCNLGNIHSDASDDSSNLWFLKKAKRISEKINFTKGLILSYKGIALFYFNKKLYNKSLHFVIKGYALNKKTNDKIGMCYSTGNLGDCLSKLGKNQLALKYYKKSLQLRKSYGYSSMIANVYLKISTALYCLNENENALIYWRKGLTLSKKSKSKNEIVQFYELSYKIHEAKLDFKKSLTYFKLFHEYKINEIHEYNNATLDQIKKKTATEIALSETLLLRKKNEEINQHLNKLEKINSDLIQFTHIASHDLKEPVRTVIMHLSLLQKRVNESNQEFIDIINTAQVAGERLYQIITGLNSYLDIDRVNKQTESICLENLAHEVKASLEQQIIERNAKIEIGELPNIHCDKLKMSVLFQNMMSNGIVFNESSQPIVKIYGKTENKKSYLIFKDNGIGVPKEYSEKIFEVFKQVLPEKSMNGIGLGLSICKKIVEELNGTIQIELPPEGGSEFKIQIPEMKV